MSDVSRASELINTSLERWRSLRMAGFEWRHVETFERAWEHHASELRRRSSSASFQAIRLERIDGSSPPPESREAWRVWLEKPNRRRAEFYVGDNVVRAIFIGSTWWSSSPRGFMTNDGAANHSHGFGPGEALVDPGSHLAALDLSAERPTTFLSRAAFVVNAVPRIRERDGVDLTLHMLGTGADEYELIVDAEVGVLLRCQANFRGAAFRVIEADQFGVDEDINGRIFDPEVLRGGITGL